MKSIILITIFSTLLFACSPQQSTSRELKIQSSSLSSNAQVKLSTSPFCLHVKFNNNYLYLYSENYAEGWVTDGACEADGSKRAVENIGIGWRYKGEGQSNNQCANSESCSFSERNYGIGKTIECAASSAKDGNQSAHVTTDGTACL